jgi:dual specificity tyrosine-phosphorylation-regulated kinase 2/3/4
LKLLSPKISLSTRSSNNNGSTASVHRAQAGTPASSRQSLSTPSPVPSTIDEEELLGDEEMMQYIRRQQTKKMAHGASQAELDDLLKFPEPITPSPGSTPQGQLLPTPRDSIIDFRYRGVKFFPGSVPIRL